MSITSYAPGSGRRVRPRSRMASSAAEVDLSGTWRFRYSARPDLAPAGAEAVDLDESGWDTIAVPSHWVLQGREDWGRPIYTNVDFPFPVEPPHVPDENPTGDYRVAFDLPDGFGDRVYLRFDGVESVAVVSLNGVEVGVVRGSRLAQELDVTDEAVAGRNVLHVRVHQWSAGSYLEDQDQWWLPGIFREVTVLARPARGIEDVWLRADYDPATGLGRILPEFRADAEAYPLTLRVAGTERTFASPEEVSVVEVGRSSRGARTCPASTTLRWATPSRPAACASDSGGSRSSATNGGSTGASSACAASTGTSTTPTEAGCSTRTRCAPSCT